MPRSARKSAEMTAFVHATWLERAGVAVEQAVAQGLALANHSGVVPRVVTDPATRDAAKVGARRSGRAAKGKAAAKK